MCGLYPSSPSSRAFFFFLMIRPPPRSTLFPYPPLFRSGPCRSPTRALAPAPADGALDLARAPPERAVALLDDGVDRARLAEADVRAHERLARGRGERDPRHDGNPVLVRDDVDVLDVARRRHRRVHTHRHGDDRAVLGDERDVELDQALTVPDRPAREHALHRDVDALVEPDRLGAGGPRRGGHPPRRRPGERTARSEHPPSRERGGFPARGLTVPRRQPVPRRRAAPPLA